MTTPLVEEEDELKYIEVKTKIHVEELSPEVFAYLRTLDDIGQSIIKNSLDPENNTKAVFKAGESQGKSGSFFFFSEDRDFIIKTMTESDLSTFKAMFKEYVSHVSRNPDSMLARVYGIYTVTMGDIVPIHLILMGNTKKTFDNDKMLKFVFDLKGSLVNREVKYKKKTVIKNTTTLKDINLKKMKGTNEVSESNILINDYSFLNSLKMINRVL